MNKMRFLSYIFQFFLVNILFAQSVYDGFTWRHVGPVRGGRSTAVAGVRQHEGTFFLGSTGGGLWKSTDFGISWRNVSDGYFDSPSIGSINVAPSDPQIIYVGTGSDGIRSNVIIGSGVYKTINGGETWKSLGLEKTGQIGAVRVHPSNHNIVYVAAIGQPFQPNEDRGIFKTIDGGATWKKIMFLSSTVGFSDIEFHPTNPEILYASAWKVERKPWNIMSGGGSQESGFYKSVDGGTNWLKIIEGLPKGLVGKIDIAVTPADSKRVYLLIEAPEKEGGLYKSEDAGVTFSLISNHQGIQDRPFYYTNIVADPKNADRIYGLATNFFRSDDAGKNWKNISVPHGDSHDMWINPDKPELCIQSNDGGANVTFNGGMTWTTQFNQPTAEIYQVEVDNQHPYWLYGGMQDNYTTISVPSEAPYGVQLGDIGWLVNTGGCETGPAVPNPNNPDIVYSNCKGRFGVYNKKTGVEEAYYVGASNIYGHNPKDLKYRFQRVAPITLSPHDPSIIYHGSQYVHKTTDEGKTWEIISPDLTAFEADKQVISGTPITRDITGEEYYSTLYSIRESGVKSGVIWTGSNDGPIYLTKNHGQSWQNVTPKNIPSGGRVDALEPSPHRAEKVYAAIHRYQLGDWKPYLLRSADWGASWALLTSGTNGIPVNEPIRVVREDSKKEGLLFAGTDKGVYVSVDDGKNWNKLKGGLPQTQVTDIKLHRDDVVISTMGRGFWILDDYTAFRNWSSIQKTGIMPVSSAIRYRYPLIDGTILGRPKIVMRYYLDSEQINPVVIEIKNNKGDILVRYSSESSKKEQTIENMQNNRPIYLSSQEINTVKGLHEFSWDMRQFGAWDSNENRRYRNGVYVSEGEYTVHLTTDQGTTSQSFTVTIDPRSAQRNYGGKESKVQEEFALQIRDLLSEARRFAEEVKNDESWLSIKEKLISAGGDYPMPMLLDQISYLYAMSDDADQLPGRDALERYSELKNSLNDLKSQFIKR